MKNTQRVTFLFFLSMLVVAFCAGSALAIPKLQIYIPGATYDTATETWVINSTSYDLWVIGAKEEIYDVRVAFAVPEDEDGSISFTWLDPAAADYGTKNVSSLLFDETNPLTYKEYTNSYYNSPHEPDKYAFVLDGTPLMGDGSAVPGGGKFPSDFYEYLVGDFGLSQTVQNYIPGDEWGDTDKGEVKKFGIDVSGYSWVDIIAYDHYMSKSGAKYVFSPYSHDGGGGTPIPEPATMLMVGTGLIGLAGLVRRSKRARKSQLKV